MKELVGKFKELQTQNMSLQNENQCLKKNISALIKTARVEINRKQDEIDRLNQRPSTSVHARAIKLMSLPLMRPSKATCQDESRLREFEPKNMDSSAKADLKQQAINSKNSSYSPKLSKETDIDAGDIKSSCSSKFTNVKTNLQKGSLENCLSVNETKVRKERHIEFPYKDNDRRPRREEHRNSTHGIPSEKKSADLKDKTVGYTTSQIKNTSSRESRVKRSETNTEKSHRKSLSSSSQDKSSSLKDRVQSKDEPYSKEKLQKTLEKSSNRDYKDYEKEKNTENRSRVNEKNDDPPRRSKRTSYLKDESLPKSKSEITDHRRGSDAGRRAKYNNEYNKDSDYKSSQSSSSTITNHKKSKREDKHLPEIKDIKYNWDKKDENKRSKEKAGHRNDRKEKKHIDEGIEKLQVLSKQSSEVERFCRTEDQCPTELNAQKNLQIQKQTLSVKDLKLSYMETLNLTLSSPKKKSNCYSDTNQQQSLTCDKENLISGVKILEAATQIDDSCASKDISTLEEKSVSHEKNISELVNLTFDAPPMEKETLSNAASHTNEFEPGPKLCFQEQELKDVGGESEGIHSKTELSLGAVVEVSVDDDLPTVNAVKMETQFTTDGSEIIDMDSMRDIDECSGCDSPPRDEDSAAQTGLYQDNLLLSNKLHRDAENHTIIKSITEPIQGICKSSNIHLVEISTKEDDLKQCFIDDCSKNIDLHFIRRIPKVISPLKSPMRPLVKLHRIDYTGTASVVRVLNKASIGNRSTHFSKELNKENFQPVCKNGPSPETCSMVIISSDEMEEGEIVSDVEEVIACTVTRPTNQSPKASLDKENVSAHPVTLPGEDTSLRKPNGIISPPKQAAAKSRRGSKSFSKKLLQKNNKKVKGSVANCCLEDIMKIERPSTVQDVLQMMRVIRKHIRKKYMKFKMQFTVRQYHKVIEIGTFYFLALVKTIDWSTVCSSPRSLQKKLCKYLERKLKKLKKNGIVDRIFEQHLLDMKKKLWKFVEDQLDSLFDIMNALLLKFCDKATIETNGDESFRHIRNRDSLSVKENSLHHNKAKSESVKENNLHHNKAKSESQTVSESHKTEPNIFKNIEEPGIHCSREQAKTFSLVRDSKSEILLCGNKKSELKGVPHCSKIIPSERQKSETSSLTFNLVSDDHMGDIFKNLLSDLETLENNKTSEDKAWGLKTPEKTNHCSPRYETIISSVVENTPMKTSLQPASSFSWPPLTPTHLQPSSFSTFETVVNPDALDESCMLEIPLSSSSSNNLPGSEERTKFFSSVLMEDLAVSLTVPSPLKSDSHLSFLQTVTAHECISEEIISKQYSEDPVLEEDVAEQDLHLTLDSDNSNSSFENTNKPSSFHCLTSEPMQAVIMEKSNDHFIVKIRRAVSASPPNFDCPFTEKENADEKDLANHFTNVSLKEAVSPGNKCSQICKNEVCQISKHEDHLSGFNKDILEHFVNDESKEENLVGSPQKGGKETNVPLLKSVEPADHIGAFSRVISGTNINLTCLSDTDQTKHENCNISPEQIAEEEIICNKRSTGDFNDKSLNKRKKSIIEEPLAKRQCVECLQPKSKVETKKQDKIEAHNIPSMESSQRRHTRSASDGTVNLCSSSKCSSSSLSAKNVIKKKGEVVVSWSREEDRLILLECQRLGPNMKTFFLLSSKIKKLPNQIEERFRQLMKLFKKSRYSSS
ncbi:hypothetical protein GDO86_009801 [Hymenochirus boettgeri]|uniref:CASP8-associated protein 2 n=1 Tax=Hymenochirus boettgeri TaxID=247094 RepID=A0A8T2JMP4_9PIPI|nr:hypothetical protein GDO86_009801 [Hymenochirus boettgeri]KAG8444764.1 hypothetical protein GDO86_009801 [Hymenochirus boettgeri]